MSECGDRCVASQLWGVCARQARQHRVWQKMTSQLIHILLNYMSLPMLWYPFSSAHAARERKKRPYDGRIISPGLVKPVRRACARGSAAGYLDKTPRSHVRARVARAKCSLAGSTSPGPFTLSNQYNALVCARRLEISDSAGRSFAR